MKECKRSVADNEDTCFGYTLSIINGKWKMLIIFYLSKYEPIRYNELQRMIRKITYKILSSTLKEMEYDGLIHRKESPQIPQRSSIVLPKRAKLFGLLYRACANGENAIKNQNKAKNRAR